MSKITLDNLSDNLKAYLEGLGLSEEQVLNLINENGLDEEELKAMLKDTMSINELNTNSKTVIGAINELFQSANNGKQLIANAIGEPLDSNDTFSAMSNDINSLLSTFKTNMMNNGITVESGDKFKQLIDKIATMVEEGSGKGIQYASGGPIKRTNNAQSFTHVSGGTINLLYADITNLTFTPTILIVTSIDKSDVLNVFLYDDPYLGSQIVKVVNGSSIYILKTDSSVFRDNNVIRIPVPDTYGQMSFKWSAIGVGEEDTTLRDSLASILTEEGVSVTEEDDMASLISKVDSEFSDKENEISNLTNELAGKVTPAGTAVAGNVLTGKTFINSTGQTITGTMANNGTKTITPKASAQSLGAGYYDKITINGDADLVAANIVSGKNIFGVTGSATPSSLGGKNYATGTFKLTCTGYSGSTQDVTYSLSFTPSLIILRFPNIKLDTNKSGDSEIINAYNVAITSASSYSYVGWDGTYCARYQITNITSTGFTLSGAGARNNVNTGVNVTWYALG